MFPFTCPVFHDHTNGTVSVIMDMLEQHDVRSSHPVRKNVDEF
jgi:hypothetical protein